MAYTFFNKTLSPNSMYMIERFNRTIRTKIDNYMKEYNTHRFVDIIKDLIYNYNNTVHSSIGITP